MNVVQVSDPKTPFSVYGKRFATREAAEKYAAETAARRSKLAGRELSIRELLKGRMALSALQLDRSY